VSDLAGAIRLPATEGPQGPADQGVGAQLRVPSFGLDRGDLPDLEAAAAAREEGVDDPWTWGYEVCGYMTHLAIPDSRLVREAVSVAPTGKPQISLMETAPR
jgi:hypothetical protein